MKTIRKTKELARLNAVKMYFEQLADDATRRALQDSLEYLAQCTVEIVDYIREKTERPFD